MAREMIVMPYDERWPRLFESEKFILQSVFGGTILDIQHIGSTSIKGMAAKPTIDILIAVDNIDDVDRFNEKMAIHGYMSRGEQGIAGRRYFVRLKEDGENHAAHIHMYGKGNLHIIEETMFRDFLSIDGESFLQYESLKKEASEKHRYSPGEYQDAKSDCIEEIMRKARKYYANG
jgi:GrpB-like predicted nucleotidyltransferase (UPF0157 family)